MRKMKVRHRRLPGIGDLYELDTAAGETITVIGHRSGRRDVAIGRSDSNDSLLTTGLTRSEATALAMLLTGVNVELTATAVE